MEDNEQQAAEESQAEVLAKQLKKISYELEDSILQVFNDDNENGMTAMQVGTPDSDEEPVSWFKILFSSGNTYLFTLKSYVDFCLKSARACKEADAKELAKLVDESKSLPDDGSESELDEAEDKETKKYIEDNSKMSSVILPIDLDEEDIASKAASIFKSFASSSSVDGNDDVLLPASYIAKFLAEFMTPRRTNGSLAQKETSTNNKASVQILFKNMPFAFYLVGYVNNIDKEQWQQAFSPIAWSGVKCTVAPKTVEDLSRLHTALSNLDLIADAVSSEEDTDSAEQEEDLAADEE